MSEIIITDEQRQSIADAIAQALGEAYDCTRVWSAWGYGTMGPDDFMLVAEDDDRVAEIADAVVEVVKVQIITDLLAELERVEKWKDAVIDACVVSWVMKKEHEHNPKLAVNDLCAWCHSVALDPKVSSDAKKLYDRIAELDAENKRLQELCKNSARKAIDIVNVSAWSSGIYSRANAVIAIADHFKLEEYDD